MTGQPAPGRPIRILQVEDNPADARLLCELLADCTEFQAMVHLAATFADGAAYLDENQVDIVLLDLGLPDSSGLDTLKRMQLKFPRLPTVILTGLNDDLMAVEALRHGAQDFIGKGEMTPRMLSRVIRYAIERKQLEQRILHSSHEWQSTFDAIRDSIVLIDAEQRIVRCNQATCGLLGLDFAHIVKQPCWSVFHGTDSPIHGCPMDKAKLSLRSETTTMRHHDRWLEVTVDPMLSDQGVLTGAVHIVRDVTERVNLTRSIEEVNELFTLFMKHSPIYCFIKEVTDSESVVLQASDNFRDMLGFSAQDMIGKSMHQLFPAEFADKIFADDLRVVDSQVNIRIEEELHGSKYLTYKFPIQSAFGRRLLAGYTIDISELKRAEETLQKSQALLNLTSEQARMGGWEIDVITNELTWTDEIYKIHEVENSFKPTVDAAMAFYAPESRPAMSRAVQRALENGTPFDLELYLLTAKHNRRLVRARGDVLLHDGRPVKVCGTFQDITEQREMENALQRQASVLKGVLESTESAVFSVDREYRYTSYNSSHARIMKELYRAEIRLGDSLAGFMTGEDSAVARANLDRALAGNAFTLEADSGDKDLRRSVFEISHNPIFGADGTVSGVAVFARDITKRKLAEQAILEMQAQVIQQEKLASIGQVAAGVAHEINNPVGFVRSNLCSLDKYIEKILEYLELEQTATVRYLPAETQQMLAGKWRQAKLDFIVKDVREMIQESREGTERIKKIIKDLMSFARKENEEFVPVDLNACLESTLTIAWSEVKSVAELKREYGELPQVMGNMQKLSQVFLNLLINASHAIEGYGTIAVRTWRSNDQACVAVSDDGCGIPEELRSKIFEPFFTTKEAGRGTGLGLAISSDIVKKHGGIIELVSEPGIGTTFIVRLPANVGEAAETTREGAQCDSK